MHPKKQLRNEAMLSPTGEIVLTRTDGSEWTLTVRRPAKSDQMELYRWMKSQWKAKPATLPNLEGVSVEDKRLLFAAFAKIEPTESDLADILMTPDGVAKQIAISAGRIDKAATFKAVRECVTEDNYFLLLSAFDDATTTEMPEDATEEQAERFAEDPRTGLPN